ncbi:MAG: hypothetical protein D6707_02770 [Bacteroidetes bacterium]|nr:MAG: hypothetical protein D6707_02770 [Bacteroidota bacterium]
MRKLIGYNKAGNILIGIFGLLFVFHLLVLSGIVPFDIVWAGRIKNKTDLIKMETISLIILIFVSSVVALRMNYLSLGINPFVIKTGVWILFAFFVLNTLGNLTAVNPIEKYGFGLLTFLISVLLLKLGLEKKG